MNQTIKWSVKKGRWFVLISSFTFYVQYHVNSSGGYLVNAKLGEIDAMVENQTR